MGHTPDMTDSDPTLLEQRSAYTTYMDSCDLEDVILRPDNVRAWVDEFAERLATQSAELILRGVGDGGERLLGALSYAGASHAEIACRSTDYAGKTVALVFTAAVSPLGLDRIAVQCRALGAMTIEAWGCAKAFDAFTTDFIDSVHVMTKSGKVEPPS